jgi:hypothetical protein
MNLLNHSLSILLLAALAATPLARAGEPQEGHGGDPFALEFADTGRALVSFVKSLDAGQLKGFTADELAKSVRKTRVISQKRVWLKGAEVAAKNFWDRRLIVVGAIRWRELGNDPLRRARLVLHEYLGVIGKDWAGSLSDGFDKLLVDHPADLARISLLRSCGLEGPLDERAELCRATFGASPKGWELILRIEDKVSIYRDLQTGLIWSDFPRYNASFTQIDAADECTRKAQPDEVFLGNIKGNLDALVDFDLPKIDEFERAGIDGLRGLTPHAFEQPFSPGAFWTGSPSPVGGDGWIFELGTGAARMMGVAEFFPISVRCVGRPKI